MDGGAWWATVHGVVKSQTRLSDFTFTFHFHALEKEMATHSSVLAWRIPGTGEPGGLPSMGSQGVGHDWSDLVAAAAAAKRRERKIWEQMVVRGYEGKRIQNRAGDVNRSVKQTWLRTWKHVAYERGRYPQAPATCHMETQCGQIL